MMERYGKIAVLAGGPSSERKISLKSGKAIYNALKRKKLDVELINVTKRNLEKLKDLKTDIAFIALHGKFGEDGTVQKILEDKGIVYTGSGIEASRIALDKLESRKIFLSNDLQVPEYKVVEKDEYANDIFKELKLPFVVKPRYEGSSIGLSIVTDKAKALSALDDVFSYDDWAIIEEYIHGKELTVGILEDKALPVIEISTEHSAYDFSAKYLDRRTKYIVPASLDKRFREHVEDSALRAHKILGCRDFSRVDIRMDDKGNVYILEVNTIPGMTERSLLPKAAKEIDLNFDDLCVKLIDLAHKRRT